MSALTAELCRTCAEPQQNANLFPLSLQAKINASKTYWEILQGLAQQDPCMEHADKLPQNICSDCCERLQNAYEFVLQTQRAEQQLLEKIRASPLDETPIDIPIEIKTEIDIDEEPIITDGNYLEPTVDVQELAAIAAKVEGPIRLPRKLRQAKGCDSNEQQPTNSEAIVDSTKQQQTDSEDDPDLDLPLAKRCRLKATHASKLQRRHASKEQSSYICETCSMRFLRRNEYMLHLRVHKNHDAKWLALQLKDEWRFADRLYGFGWLKRVECKLCERKFQRIEQLRQHLLTHANIETLNELGADNDVVKLHYAGKDKSRLLLKVKQQICADIDARQLDKYYAVVNAHGYELCLSDSDEESGDVANYECITCNFTFTRKHRVMQHTLEQHTQLATAPAYRCGYCKIGFVCLKLLAQHRRTHCYNVLRRLCCAKCPGKFMWPENLQQHACSKQTLQRLAHCQCCLCDEQFASLAQLRAHLHKHRDGRNGIDAQHKAAYFQSYYPNGVNCSAKALRARIVADFEAQDYARYYNASTSSGNEQALYDSDARDDGPQERQHTAHECQHCGQRFVWQGNYELHLRQKHPQSTLQCKPCSKVFVTRKGYVRHMRVHQTQVLYQCSLCEGRFNRKVGLSIHQQRVHGRQLARSGQAEVLTQRCRPNGYKHIQCMICLSRHRKIIDLRTHLLTHRTVSDFSGERSIADISRSLYPELELPMAKAEELSARIRSDVEQQLQLERFYSIANESGHELSLDSSETDTDGEVLPERLYACELCEVRLPRKHQLNAHQLQQHEWREASHVCRHCRARFVNGQLLQHHVRTMCGNSQKRHQCKKCPLRFRWPQNLELHTDVQHADVKATEATAGRQTEQDVASTYDCLECPRNFRTQRELSLHKLTHANKSGIYYCRWCLQRYYRASNLLQHVQQHGIANEQLPYAEALFKANLLPNGPKLIVCKVCEQSFESIAALRAHLEAVGPSGTHHPHNSMLNYSITNELGYELHIDDSETDEESKSGPNTLPYSCDLCQVSVRRKRELHRHQQAKHQLELIKPKCAHCIFKSVAPSLVEHHVRMQCGNAEKQFACPKCRYRFMWQANLERHLQLQHGDTPAAIMEIAAVPSNPIFQCTLCPRKYNRKDRLSTHMKKCHAVMPRAKRPIAPPEKCFLCDFCGLSVNSSSNFIKHLRRHTDVERSRRLKQ